MNYFFRLFLVPRSSMCRTSCLVSQESGLILLLLILITVNEGKRAINSKHSSLPSAGRCRNLFPSFNRVRRIILEKECHLNRCRCLRSAQARKSEDHAVVTCRHPIPSTKVSRGISTPHHSRISEHKTYQSATCTICSCNHDVSRS